MAHKNRTLPDTWRWGLHLIVGVLFMVGIVFFSGWRALRATEERFCQTLDFVKSQSTSFEKYNDTVVAKALRRAAVAVHQLAQDPALDFSDPQCLKKQTETLWLTGISVLAPDGTLLCESTTNGIGYARFGEQLKNDTVLDVFSYLQKTYLKRVLLEDGSAVDVAAYRAEDKDVILLAYRYTPAEFVEGTALSIQSILDGYSAETSGTLFIVQDDQVIASNRPELIGQDAADSPLVQGIRKVVTAETLTHTRGWNGSGCYFGMYCHGRSFDLYAYTDERSVFRESLPLILMALVSYILLVMILQVLRRRSVQEMEQQKKEQEKKYQAQLEEQNRKLEIALQHEGAANRAKREFLFNMSHDIRTPMNAIIGYADLAEKHRQEPERLQGYLKNIQVSGEKMLSIIDNVLELSRIESGKVTLEETAVEAGSIFESCVVMVQPELERKHQTMTVEKHTPNPYLYMDTSRILEVILNLVSNAIKYTGDGGHIRCAIRQLPSDREGWCVQELSVADNGIGMSEEFQQHIFEAFARERSSTVSGVEGSGLGMGIVKKLVDLMDGSIDIQSKLGEGSTFTVYIPCRLARQEDAVPKRAAERVDKTGLAGRRILLAEDNDLNAEITAELMGEEGLLVDRAENGAHCLEMLEKAPAGMYDAILMDVQMPVLDGYEATQKIRRLTDPWRANIPIIAITANAFAEDRQRALEVGMDDHVAKPIDMAKLIPVLQKQLHKHDGEAEEKHFSQSVP